MPKIVKKQTKTADIAVEPKKSAPKKAQKAEKAVKKPRKTAEVPVAAPETETVEPTAEKMQIIEQFQVAKGDTGSPEVQVALLSKRIEKLVSHLKLNPSDNHSRRGLLGIVSKRRRLLNYLEKKDKKRYKEVTVKLGMSK